MAVSNSIPINIYVASGSTTNFSYTFRVLSGGDLNVYVNSVLASPSTYTVTGINAHVGGLVIFNTPPAANSIIRIQRDLDMERTTDYVEGGALPAETLDNDFDRLTMQIQDLSRDTLKADVDGKYDAGLIVIKNVASPTDANDAATKNYVDQFGQSQIGNMETLLQQAQVAATASANSSTQAGTYRDQTNTLYVSFNTIYYGARPTPPTIAPGGGVLTAGAAYFDLVTNRQMIWNGTSWVAAFTTDADLASLGIPNHDKILVDAAGNVTFQGTATGLSKTAVGLSNVDNTSDTNKPVSTAQQTALNLKANLSGGNLFVNSQRASQTTLGSSGTVTLDLAAGNAFLVSLTGNVTMANPTAASGGGIITGTIRFVQDATGSRSVAWGSNWKGASGALPVLSTSPNAVDLVSYYALATTGIVYVKITKDIK